MVKGTFMKHPKGFGFVAADDAEEGSLDIFISPDDTNGAMSGDRVLVDLIPEWLWERTRPEGIISRVLERNVTEITGTFRFSKKGGIVYPADARRGMEVTIPAGETSGARDGDKVVVKILSYPDGKKKALGHVSQIIARRNEAGADIKEMIRSKGFQFTFPSSARAQAAAIEKNGISESDCRGRRDLRKKKVFTIDGASSRDFDDAVSIEKLPDGNYLLGVHIADVTHYVSENSPLDMEALKRGNSVYVLDQVVPMLPKELSNGICSLNEGVNRLCLSVDMTVDGAGKVISHDIYESVICSCHRLVYEDVSDILENGDDHLINEYEDIYDELLEMEELYRILAKARDLRGSIDFDAPEAEIELDRKGNAIDVSPVERRTANRLIEEFMLLANETVAQHFFWMDLPFIYRVHEKPEAKKMAEFKLFLEGFSIRLKSDVSNVHPKVLSDILKEIEGSRYEGVVSTVMLRSMQKAYYSNECGGHYGLSLTYYAHFTSPIRRYADLFIHRVIKESLHGSLNAERISLLSARASEAADAASGMERLALEAERDGEKMKKAEYMKKHIGEVYDGIISGIANLGFFVQLPNTVEGMVRLDSLSDDYYLADMAGYRVIGEGKKKIYALGDRVKVKCIGANVYEHTVDFVLDEQKKKKKRRNR